MTQWRRVFVSLGSNLGDRAAYLSQAREALAGLDDTRLLATSRIFETAPQDLVDQPAFLNQVVCLETGQEPLTLLRSLQQVERRAGRVREVRFGPRTLDLDILLVEDVESADPTLTLPHPRLWRRAFVLAPLTDVWWLARGMPQVDVHALAQELAREQIVRVYVEGEGGTSADRSAQQSELRRLAAERNAVILAHNYERAEVQDAADFVGDSLELARKAAATNADVILFCGVHFMAETAAILSPQKTVLMPDLLAGCPMANMVTADALRALKAEHPQAVVVTYVNSGADVKAESDVCCTSANAVDVVRRYPREREIIFVPDRNLGGYVARQLDRPLRLWDGYCHVHDRMRAEEVLQRKSEHPGARVMAHPECRREVLDLADAILSTSGMLKLPATDDADQYIVCTEVGLLHRLGQLYPHKRFYPISPAAICPDMKVTTLDTALVALRDGLNEVRVPPTIRERALRAVQRMVEE